MLQVQLEKDREKETYSLCSLTKNKHYMHEYDDEKQASSFFTLQMYSTRKTFMRKILYGMRTHTTVQLCAFLRTWMQFQLLRHIFV